MLDDSKDSYDHVYKQGVLDQQQLSDIQLPDQQILVLCNNCDKLTIVINLLPIIMIKQYFIIMIISKFADTTV